MASSKFESLWRLMSTYNLEIVGEVPSGVTCYICSKLMIEPYAAECGCQFCSTCIKDYLKDGSKKCPVSNAGCGEETLRIDTNVFKDVRTNSYIKNVTVKCPHEWCSFSTALGNIEEHINACSMKTEQCPFYLLGCSDGNRLEGSIGDHLHNNAYAHTQILVRVTDNLRKDLDEVRNKLELRENEIEELKVNMGRYKTEMDDFKETVMEKMRAELKRATEEIKAIYSSESVSNLEIVDSQTSGSKDREGINEAVIKKERNEILTETKLDDESRHTDEITTMAELKMQSQNTGMDEIEANKLKVELTIKNDVSKETERQSHNFQWIIDGFSKMITAKNRNKPFYSEEFYANNYTLCLCGRITEVSSLKDKLYLELYLIIMKGKEDVIAQWPMKNSIELIITNQLTMVAHKSGTYSYDKHKGSKYRFDKPMKEMNDFIGGLSIAANEIIQTSGILVKDTVMVNCSISDDNV